MSQKRGRLIGWTYDDDAQEIRSPSGKVITLAEVAQRLQDDVACHHDFGGEWSGWKMRHQFLITPPNHLPRAAIVIRGGTEREPHIALEP
jgi:hypothetical protein